jgi:hypothetical protein
MTAIVVSNVTNNPKLIIQSKYVLPRLFQFFVRTFSSSLDDTRSWSRGRAMDFASDWKTEHEI